ncbi:helix-turn-helix domain-containing protein [bacterium]|nr:helix-turn-helix domain-containing protein [bacterium]
MPDTLFPVFPPDSRYINSKIAIKIIKDSIYYFNGEMPIYHHHKDDYQSFRYITSQIVDLGIAKQMEIVRTFKVSKESVKRWVKTYREKGGNGFFNTRTGKKKGNVLTDDILGKVQSELNLGKLPKAIGNDLKIKPDTIKKAISDGRLTKLQLTNLPDRGVKTKSERSQIDSTSPLGMGCTNTSGRIDAVVKKK